MAERTTQDMRRYRRQTLRILVDYVTEKGIGAGGMFIESDEPLQAGDTLKARFKLPQGDQIHEVEGRVVWSRAPGTEGHADASGGMGIKFVDQESISRLARELEDYVL
ncbi:MAG: PilZ domain-containing protein [Deltaproteobacteria bacterium]|nr:PilZ domain-containing protein [Deltaproteobacteria bacterium]